VTEETIASVLQYAGIRREREPLAGYLTRCRQKIIISNSILILAHDAEEEFCMAEKQTILTAEGLEKLKAELNELRTVKRLENEERLHEAISHGDLSENSEYDAAKDEQARIEGRIQEIEQMLKTAVVIDNSKKRKSEVELGTTVTIEDLAPEFEEDKNPGIYGCRHDRSGSFCREDFQ
jgi:hypothetical protein